MRLSNSSASFTSSAPLRRSPATTVSGALVACLMLIPALASYTQGSFTPAEQAGIQEDTARHFGDAPQDPGPRATNLSTSIKSQAVTRAMRKVGDWELERGQPYFDRIWTSSALYTGFMAAASALPEPRYRDAMLAMGEKYDWQLRSALPNADDQSVGQTYLELYMQQHDAQMRQPTQTALDALLNSPPIPVPRGQANIPWWWCDALFMAPPVWARMYAATRDAKYLRYLETNWWQTSTLLYDPSRHLYYRDATYLHKTGEDGKPVFWSRGNGWVMAGIARTYAYLPANDPNRAKLAAQLRAMAAAVAALQDPRNGLWHSNLLDAADYPLPEVSGSSLMTYALAWGIHEHLLSRKTYMPVVAKAWAGMVQQVYADGRLGCIQQTGAAPAHYLPSSSYDYGVGGFLLAGSAILSLESGHSTRRLAGAPH